MSSLVDKDLMDALGDVQLDLNVVGTPARRGTLTFPSPAVSGKLDGGGGEVVAVL